MTNSNDDANATKSCLNVEALLEVLVTKPLMPVETELTIEVRNLKCKTQTEEVITLPSLAGYIDTPAGRGRNDAGRKSRMPCVSFKATNQDLMKVHGKNPEHSPGQRDNPTL